MTKIDPCKGCGHYAPISLNYGEKTQKDCHYCAYILDTGHRRPCPFGEGCTAKETSGKVRRMPNHKYDISA